MRTIFSRFFKPKWQHKDAEVRRQALLSLGVSDPEQRAILHTLAEHDPSPAVRLAALRRVDDPSLWRAAAARDPAAEVRESALNRYTRLFAGEGAWPLEDRMRRLAAESDRLAEHILRNGREAALRRAALDRLAREALFVERVLNDEDMELRLAALARIDDKGTLERLLKQTRTRDKRISGAIKERLAAMQAAQARPGLLRQRAVALLGRLEAAYERARSRNEWNDAVTQAQALHAEWEGLRRECEECGLMEVIAEAQPRYDQARTKLEEGYAAYASAQREAEARAALYAPLREEKAALLAAAERLLHDVRECVAPGRSAEDYAARAWAVLRNNWHELDVLPAQEEQDLQVRFAQLAAAVEAELADIAAYRTAASAMSELAEESTRLLESAVVPAAALAQLEQAWENLPRPARRAVPDPMELERNLAQLHERLAIAQAQRAEARQHLQRLVQDMDTAMAAGHTGAAEDIDRQIADALNNWPEAERPALFGDATLRKHGRLRARLRELLGWKHWGGVPAKERLIADMEALRDEIAATPAARVDWRGAAKRIRAAQQDWRKIGTSESERTLWQRFKTACDAAYAPCREHFAAEAQQRDANLTRAVHLCERLESFPLGEPHEFDLPAAENLLRESQQEWQSVAALPAAAREATWQRYRAAIERLRKAGQTARQLNRARKSALIEQVRALPPTGPDSRGGRETVKRAQAEWKTIGPGQGERELWAAFRAACDAWFTAQAAAREARDRDRDQALAARAALCERAEALAATKAQDAHAALCQLAELQAQWRDAPPLGRGEDREVRERWRKAVGQLEARVESVGHERARAAERRLADMTELCAALERIADDMARGTDSGPPSAADIECRWAELAAQATVPGELAGRYAQARDWHARLLGKDQSTASAWHEFQQRNLAAKEELCLEAEMIAGIPSPAEYQGARMAHQVARLGRVMAGEDRMKEGDQALRLRAAWRGLAYTMGREEALQRRFTAALNTLDAAP